MNTHDRRSFLKGLIGTVAAGSYVLTNPMVVAGDLLVPSPEPTIIKATVEPVRVGSYVDAFITQVNTDVRYGGLIEIELRMKVTLPDDVETDLIELLHARSVRLYPVWK